MFPSSHKVYIRVLNLNELPNDPISSPIPNLREILYALLLPRGEQEKFERFPTRVQLIISKWQRREMRIDYISSRCQTIHRMSKYGWLLCHLFSSLSYAGIRMNHLVNRAIFSTYI